MRFGIRSRIIGELKDFKENYNIKNARDLEIKKFKDPRRVEIYSKYQLSNSEKDMIDELYLKNYGEKIPYIWHQHYSAFSGRFDVNYFPELLYIPEMQRFLNPWTEYCKTVSDKNLFSEIADSGNVLTPTTIVSCSKNMFRNSKYEMITKEKAALEICGLKEVFIKPTVDTSSGKNCIICHINSIEEALFIFDKMGMDFAIQERLKCHESISRIYANSVNTFRIITYRWKDDILRTPSVLRIGKGGSYLDNAHAGGIFIAIEDDGTLHDTAYTEFRETYKEHPDTKLKFRDYKIDLFPRIIEAAIRMHQMIPQIGIIHWDFTLNEDGEPVVLEANVRAGGIWLCQMSHGKGPFGDKTSEILQWISFMKKQNTRNRLLYPFGKQ